MGVLYGSLLTGVLQWNVLRAVTHRGAYGASQFAGDVHRRRHVASADRRNERRDYTGCVDVGPWCNDDEQRGDESHHGRQ
jgi:hypothetical protein